MPVLVGMSVTYTGTTAFPLGRGWLSRGRWVEISIRVLSSRGALDTPGTLARTLELTAHRLSQRVPARRLFEDKFDWEQTERETEGGRQMAKGSGRTPEGVLQCFPDTVRYLCSAWFVSDVLGCRVANPVLKDSTVGSLADPLSTARTRARAAHLWLRVTVRTYLCLRER